MMFQIQNVSFHWLLVVDNDITFIWKEICQIQQNFEFMLHYVCNTFFKGAKLYMTEFNFHFYQYLFLQWSGVDPGE